MPKKKALKLENIKVTSFLTSEENRNVIGKAGSTGSPYLFCYPDCDIPTEPMETETCHNSCYGTCYNSCNGTCYNSCNGSCNSCNVSCTHCIESDPGYFCFAFPE